MFNVFESLKKYAQSWNVKEVRPFNEAEIKSVKEAEVIESSYGNSVCFTMVSGVKTYMPVSNDTTACVGDKVDISKAELIVLERDGDDDINRIRIL